MIGCAVSVVLVLVLAGGTRYVTAPAASGEKVFHVPPDSPEPVTFILRNWVCVQGDLDKAAKALTVRLATTPPEDRAAFLGLDLDTALARLTGLVIRKDPGEVVPAPGQKTVPHCYDTATWRRMQSRFQILISETPYQMPANGAPKVSGQPSIGGNGSVFTGPNGGIWTGSEVGGLPPDTVGISPEGRLITGGALLGRVLPDRRDGATDQAGKPVYGKDGTLAGHVLTDPNGTSWFTPEIGENASLAQPQPVEILPGGTVLWGGISLGRLGRSSAQVSRPEPVDETIGQPVRGRDGAIIGHLQTSPDGHVWFAPETPEGVMPSEPQAVELLPGGSVLWAGRRIGSVNAKAPEAPRETNAKGKTARAPANSGTAAAAVATDPEALALQRIEALKAARKKAEAKLAELIAQKKVIDALIHDELQKPGRYDKPEVERLEKTWKRLRRAQGKVFDRIDQLREALNRARAVLPEARKRSAALRRASVIRDFVASLYGAANPEKAFSPLVGVLQGLDKALGAERLDELVKGYRPGADGSSPVGFFGYLVERLSRDSHLSKTAAVNLEHDYAAILAAILGDPMRARLWGVRPQDTGKLHETALNVAGRVIGHLDAEARQLGGRKAIEKRIEALRVALLRQTLTRGKARQEAQKGLTGRLAALARLVAKEAAANPAKARGYWVAYARGMRGLTISAMRVSSPFGPQMSRLFAQELARTLVARAQAANAPGEASAKLWLQAARAYSAGGNVAKALANARIAEQYGGSDTVRSARLLQLALLQYLRGRAGGLSKAEGNVVAMLGRGESTQARLRTAISGLLKTLAHDRDADAATRLGAALVLARDSKTRAQGETILRKMLDEAKENGDPVPPLLAAWEIIGKWPKEGMAPFARTDTLARLVGGNNALLAALSTLVFDADMPAKARHSLALAIENLYWRRLGKEKDTARRNTLIRAAIVDFGAYLRHYYVHDPDILAATNIGSTTSEAERIHSDLIYWVNRLPEAERAKYTGLIALARAVRGELQQRRTLSERLRSRHVSSNRDSDKLIRTGVVAFKRGDIRNAATALLRAIKLAGAEKSPMETQALVGALIRMAEKQTTSDMPLVLRAKLKAANLTLDRLKALTLMTPEQRQTLLKLGAADKAALVNLVEKLRASYGKALSKATAEARVRIVKTHADTIAGISEDAKGDAALDLARARQAQMAAIARYRRLRAKQIANNLAGKSTKERRITLAGRLETLRRKVRAEEKRTRNLSAGGNKVNEAGTSVRKQLVVQLAGLALLRAERDAVEDVLMRDFPRANGLIGNRRENRVRSLFAAIAGTAERHGGGVVQELIYYGPNGNVGLTGSETEKKNTAWIRIFLQDRLRYLRARRRDIFLEDPTRDPSEGATAYERELRREVKFLKEQGAWLSGGIFDFGQTIRALSQQLEHDIRFREKPTLVDRLIMAGRSADPQKFFAYLARLQSEDLDAGLASYTKYLETPWYRLGLSQGYYQATDRLPWGSYWNYNAVLDRFKGHMDKVEALNGALLSASRLSAREFAKKNPRAYRMLVERGFISDGKYVIPDDFVFRSGNSLDQASRLTMLDRLVNVQTVGEALVTVALPGKLAASGARYLADRWLISNALGRLGLEAALFTGYSRAGSLMIDPSLGLGHDYWTMKSVLRDYLNNLLIMGGLQLSGHLAGNFGHALRGGRDLRYGASDILSMPLSQLREITAREWGWFMAGSSGKLGLEAATLEAIEALTSDRPLSREGFLRNLVFISELKLLGHPFDKSIEELRATRDRLLGLGTGETGRIRAARETRETAEATKRGQLIDVLLGQFGGDWHKLVDGFKAGKVDKKTMAGLVRIRQAIVDGIANQVVLEAYGPDRVSREKMWIAVGSVNLTSDYDLSFKGEKSELCVLLFNERFRARWGRALGIGGVESAGRLDTNVYTYPRHAEFSGNETDVLAQEEAALLGLRRYTTDAEWAERRRAIADALQGAERLRMENVLDRVERAYDEARKALERMTTGGNENARIRAANKLYGEALKRIIHLRDRYAQATGRVKAEIAQQIRNTQSKALLYASEAYLTEAAINHIVFNTQAIGRKITAESLLKGPSPQLPLPMDGNMARQSLLEQMGYLYHQFGSYSGHYDKPDKATKLAGKLSKYFLRFLDAAHLAGVDLKPYEHLLRLTVEVEANRGKPDKLAEILKGDKARAFDDAVREAMKKIAVEIYRKAPLTPTRQATTQSGHGRAGTSGTHHPVNGSDKRAGNTGNSVGKSAASGRPDGSNGGKTVKVSKKPRPMMDANGLSTGWIYRDPSGQIWLQPQGIPGTLPPAPQKVRVLDNGAVISNYRQIGQVVPVSRTVPGPSRKPGPSGVMGTARPPKTAQPASGPKRGGPSIGPQTATGAGQSGATPVTGRDGALVGHVWRDPNGQYWLTPPTIPGGLGTPPQKVDVGSDNAVSFGGRVIGHLSHDPGPPGQGVITGADTAAQEKPVHDRDGSIIGHLQTDPAGGTWFAPNVPPGILATPPVKVLLGGDGAIIWGGRVIGRVGATQKRPRKTAAFDSGKTISLAVRIEQGKPKPASMASTTGGQAGGKTGGAGQGNRPAGQGTGAQGKTGGAVETGFEGYWLGWHGSIIHNVREGDRIRGILENEPPEVARAGWKIGDVYAEGPVSGTRMTGTMRLPKAIQPNCPGRIEMPFEATLIENGNAMRFRTRRVTESSPCNYVAGALWNPPFVLHRVKPSALGSNSSGATGTTTGDAAAPAPAPPVSARPVAPDLPGGAGSGEGEIPLMERIDQMTKTDCQPCKPMRDALDSMARNYREMSTAQATGPNSTMRAQVNREMLQSLRQGMTTIANQLEQCLIMCRASG